MKTLHSLPSLTVAALAVMAAAGCSKPPASPRAAQAALAPLTATVHVVGTGTHQAVEEVVGTVRAKLRAVLEAKVSGRIEHLPVVTGQRVKQGELLVRLDAREIRARLDQALAVREQAENDLGRFSALLQQQAVTRAEFDAVQARQRVAQAAVTEAETLLGQSTLVAPFDGVVARKWVEIGDLAVPGRALVEIEDPIQLRFEANVPEALIDRVEPGKQLTVRVASVDRLIDAVVAEIAPSADPNSRTFLVKLDFPPQPALRAGQFGRVAIPVGEIAALRVPAAAVVQRGQMELVFVVEQGRAQLRLIKTGKRLGDEVEVISGVQAGETVILSGVHTLLEGQPIVPR
jgi:RND family efflux transporter MFP subunit